VASHTNELLYCRWGRRWKSLSSTWLFPSTMPMKYPKPYIFGTLFSEELLQPRDVVSLSFWKLYIPYQIGAFSCRYGNLSGIVQTQPNQITYKYSNVRIFPQQINPSNVDIWYYTIKINLCGTHKIYSVLPHASL
jgi:hypothetical protein